MILIMEWKWNFHEFYGNLKYNWNGSESFISLKFYIYDIWRRADFEGP